MGEAEIDHLRVPAELLDHAVTLICHGLIPWFFMCTTPQTLVLAAEPRCSYDTTAEFCSQVHNSLC